ncbi:peptidoglycan-binding domain-containing protein [Jhaorihella thermophila]|uniref:peptidoglycan-binding domain-containing protein n=1 Tax=Jhaorihella thermophila TaxID=488547 RepID=UPI003622F70A
MARALVARSLICAFVLLSFGSVAHGKSASDRPSLQGSSLESGPVLAQVSEYSRDQIRQLQRWLSDLGYDAGEPDGVIGGRTTRAVRAFEADRGRAPLGIITDEIFDLVADDWMAHTGTLARQSGNSGISPKPVAQAAM